jgi:hypothetical protein
MAGPVKVAAKASVETLRKAANEALEAGLVPPAIREEVASFASGYIDDAAKLSEDAQASILAAKDRGLPGVTSEETRSLDGALRGSEAPRSVPLPEALRDSTPGSISAPAVPSLEARGLTPLTGEQLHDLRMRGTDDRGLAPVGGGLPSALTRPGEPLHLDAEDTPASLPQALRDPADTRPSLSTPYADDLDRGLSAPDTQARGMGPLKKGAIAAGGATALGAAALAGRDDSPTESSETTAADAAKTDERAGDGKSDGDVQPLPQPPDDEAGFSKYVKHYVTATPVTAPDYATGARSQLGDKPEGEVDLSADEKVAFEDDRKALWDEYKETKDRYAWGEVGDIFARALAKLGAAWHGMRTGRDISGLKMDPLDWKSKREEAFAELRQGLADVTQRRGERTQEIEANRRRLSEWMGRNLSIGERQTQLDFDAKKTSASNKLTADQHNAGEDWREHQSVVHGEDMNFNRETQFQLDEKRDSRTVKREEERESAATEKELKARKTAYSKALNLLGQAKDANDAKREALKTRALVELGRAFPGDDDVLADLEDAESGTFKFDSTRVEEFIESVKARGADSGLSDEGSTQAQPQGTVKIEVKSSAGWTSREVTPAQWDVLKNNPNVRKAP